MKMRPSLVCMLLLASACANGSGSNGGGAPVDDEDPSTETPDGGDSDPIPGDGDGDGDGDQSLPPGDEDASTPLEPGEDAGPKDPISEVIDQVAEFTTCKPEEVNPVIECLTMTCAADLLALPGCLLNECAKLIEAVNPKCRDCVIAAVMQDTTGLLENCPDTGAITGEEPGAATLPF
jgi:hypothetical protein